MEFDINVYRSAITVLAMVLFLALMVWTWQRKRQSAFDEAAQLPFLEPDVADPSSERQ
ncbi:CcoQ/FixQ family Cbb3-type cytochrome c oxidase assembly chaperone [Ideonella sp. 4Y16]|uniref:CcoQ/FixQ family Cbb3-type cytochrome c oxidase assembly chaperone n=1 Tax=Ideonella alba TaxID=2824118 RepID=A0A941BEB5_9BURK|nr:CcoQ/FixQ family Cbb3-type cytochrome c oxidase assembly chaperone [Ideonella alba]MBQ0930976.1 CcoQ/FixQ family Cbb3-type cytochrome c oxidase assembly chaperone [Ideonella alba]MBQ0942360.1 CcoQ/FixQ family Cbb3-type cytochrome c oxidase assembly chaperone [Ideonella alba]